MCLVVDERYEMFSVSGVEVCIGFGFVPLLSDSCSARDDTRGISLSSVPDRDGNLMNSASRPAHVTAVAWKFSAWVPASLSEVRRSVAVGVCFLC